MKSAKDQEGTLCQGVARKWTKIAFSVCRRGGKYERSSGKKMKRVG